jgi:hypothetical protein
VLSTGKTVLSTDNTVVSVQLTTAKSEPNSILIWEPLMAKALYYPQKMSFEFFTVLQNSVADPDDFQPDPDPDLNKFWAKFLAINSIFMNQKVMPQKFLKYLWYVHCVQCTHTKKVEIGSFIKGTMS